MKLKNKLILCGVSVLTAIALSGCASHSQPLSHQQKGVNTEMMQYIKNGHENFVRNSGMQANNTYKITLNNSTSNTLKYWNNQLNKSQHEDNNIKKIKNKQQRQKQAQNDSNKLMQNWDKTWYKKNQSSQQKATVHALNIMCLLAEVNHASKDNKDKTVKVDITNLPKKSITNKVLAKLVKVDNENNYQKDINKENLSNQQKQELVNIHNQSQKKDGIGRPNSKQYKKMRGQMNKTAKEIVSLSKMFSSKQAQKSLLSNHNGGDLNDK